ncbi:hypothetical protein WR25_02638 [Diploscapter pachys]|uniref:CUB domain-containing protein n=1 Tax=Diploscapter pachys TaxID=2018661 RepID=A0A2A2KES2_9BILA|nr:hypothetical protein WR25_02638 [Diploscapter pachys]
MVPWLAARRNASDPDNWYNLDGQCHHLIQPFNPSFWLQGEPSSNGDCAILRSVQPPGMRAVGCHNMQPALCKQHAGICEGSGTFNGTSGTFTSPGWPTQYYNNMCCGYKIIAPPGQKVVLTVDPIMMMCGDLDIWDEFDCFDGDSVAADYIGATMNWPQTFYSTSSVLYCTMFTNAKGTNRGFAAKWNTVPIPGPIAQDGCSGVMTSPRWPQTYLPMTLQEYNINADVGYRINITFNYFAVDYMFDYLEIFDSPSLGPPLLRNISGTPGVPFWLASNTNKVSMRFTTYTRQYDFQMGFYMFWYCIPL